jgi:hypothetical protein
MQLRIHGIRSALKGVHDMRQETPKRLRGQAMDKKYAAALGSASIHHA